MANMEMNWNDDESEAEVIVEGEVIGTIAYREYANVYGRKYKRWSWIGNTLNVWREAEQDTWHKARQELLYWWLSQ